MKLLKTITASTFMALVASQGALANEITSWSCEKTSAGQTVSLVTQSAVSSAAVVNIDGTAQSGTATVTGSTVSLNVPTSVQCWAVAFTITDGGTTFGLN